MFQKPMTNSVGPDQTAPIGTVCSGSMLFASIVMLGNYLQQTTSTDDIFKCFFSWRFNALYQNCTNGSPLANKMAARAVDKKYL